MKTFLSLFAFFLAAGLTAAGTAEFVSEHGTVYQCPMHPWIKSDHPGAKCTICGMQLVAAPAGQSAAAADPNLVTLTPASAAVSGVQTSPVRRAPLIRTLRVAGIVDDDDTRHRILAARTPGRIERLFVNYVGAEVAAGAPLAVIYSPEMLTAQRTYIERLRAGNTAFTASERSASRERLLELGLTPEEIDILEHTLEPTAMLNVRAPMSGTVVSRAAYEGQYVQTNDRLFEIGDFSKMWFVFDAYEPDLAWLKVGQTVEITVASLPGRTLTAPISFIDPNLNPDTRTARVRVVLPNDDRSLLHKQTAAGLVRLETPETLVVPRSAVLQHGSEPMVFVEKAAHAYAARRVRLGRVGDDDIEVVSGIAAGDRVVTEGGLILDGQAQLARAAVTGEAPAPAAPPPAAPPADDHGYALLQPLALASADAAARLASDDFVGYQKHLPALRTALQAYLDGYAHAMHGPLAKYQAALRDPIDLRTARRDFEPFTTDLTDLVRELGMPQREGWHVFQCPMAPVLGTGRWLSRGAEVHNPFFGSAMPDCGEELK
jgi:Cu(I)/Ag(I) efflux system membrane fusion protein